MSFRKFDAGDGKRAKGVRGDCQVRALTTATGMPYETAWELLYKLQGERRSCGFPIVESLTAGDVRLGVKRSMPFPAVRGAHRAHGLGKDAIRVVAIFEQGSVSHGICKLPRVHRTGSLEAVLDRMLGRMREAYQACCDARPKNRVHIVPGVPQVSDLNFIPRVFGKYADGSSGMDNTPRVFMERTPRGTINNCALANNALEKDCQVCQGSCPDGDRS